MEETAASHIKTRSKTRACEGNSDKHKTGSSEELMDTIIDKYRLRRRSSEASTERTLHLLSAKKHFNVFEDSIILAYWLEHKLRMTTLKISNELQRLVGHSAESIRDRIKRYLSRLNNFDQAFLIEEAKVLFSEFL